VCQAVVAPINGFAEDWLLSDRFSTKVRSEKIVKPHRTAGAATVRLDG
jgi:hypothetical protein